MKKNNCLYNIYNLIFAVITLVPFIVLIAQYCQFQSDLTFVTVFARLGIDFADNSIYTAITGIFGSDGVLPLVTDTTVLYPFVWIVCVTLIRLAVDILLFIPLLCEKFIFYFNSKERW